MLSSSSLRGTAQSQSKGKILRSLWGEGKVSRNTIAGLDFLIFGTVVASLGYLAVQSVPIAAFGFAFALIGALVLLLVPENNATRELYKSIVPDSIENVEI